MQMRTIALDSPTSSAARAVRERQELLLNYDPQDDATDIPGTRQMLTALFAPLIVDDRVLGVMSVQSDKQNAYRERERLIFRNLTAYGAIALANAAAVAALHQAQGQLVQQEKMASLGQLVANVAHELNSPFGAVKSSGQMIATSLNETIHQFPKLILMLNATERELFIRLVSHRQAGILTSRERRTLILDLEEKLTHAGIAQARPKAEVLVALLAHAAYEAYLPLLRHPACDIILKTASVIGDINNGASIISNAVDRAAKIVTTLNSFAHTDVGGVMGETDLQEGIETILDIYRNQIMQNTELVCEFEKTAPFNGQPQELNQIWTHLIHNALQAMDYKGRLTVGLKQTLDEVVVSITDTGHGIPDEIKDRIFEPFFTTRPLGEGGGLGLSIAQKIVTKYLGRIEVRTVLGAGTTFSVHFPLPEKTARVA
jgi:signal transduction histidine kinase